MKIERDLTADQLGDDLWLAVEGVCSDRRFHRTCTDECGEHHPPADVRALLDPCETCGGHPGSVEADHWDLTDPDNHLGWVPCPDCINGRRKVDIVVPTEVCQDPDSGQHCRHWKSRQSCCYCPGTVSRTYIVADDPALLPVYDDYRIHPLPYIWRNNAGAVLVTTGRKGPLIIVGATKRTTHALHIKAVTA